MKNPKALEARQLRDTYHYFGCEPGLPTFRYDIIDAVKDPEGPFLCLPKIFDLRSDITTKALAEKGWAVLVNEQEETFKIQDLERKIFTPARNRLMCEAFLKEAQQDPAGALGKSLIFAVSQNPAWEGGAWLRDGRELRFWMLIGEVARRGSAALMPSSGRRTV